MPHVVHRQSTHLYLLRVKSRSACETSACVLMIVGCSCCVKYNMMSGQKIPGSPVEEVWNAYDNDRCGWAGKEVEAAGILLELCAGLEMPVCAFVFCVYLCMQACVCMRVLTNMKRIEGLRKQNHFSLWGWYRSQSTETCWWDLKFGETGDLPQLDPCKFRLQCMHPRSQHGWTAV